MFYVMSDHLNYQTGEWAMFLGQELGRSSTIDADSVIVLGNGPSLADVDLRSLGSFPAIGMNAAYRYWERIGWYPTYYACLDDIVVQSHHRQIRDMVEHSRCRAYFLHQNILRHHPELAQRDEVFILSSFVDNALHEWPRVEHGVPVLDYRGIRSFRTEKVTTGGMAGRFAAFLGYIDILLLGVDANYVEVVSGAIEDSDRVLRMKRTPNVNQNYFFADYQQEGDLYNRPTPPGHTGNLHLENILDMVTDLRQMGRSVSIGTKKSNVYASGKVPFLSLEDFLANAAERRGRGPNALPRKDVAKPSYIPIAEGGIIFARCKVTGGVVQTNLAEWTWPQTASMENGSLAFVVAAPEGELIPTGVTISAQARIQVTGGSASQVRVRLARDDDGPFEAVERKSPTNGICDVDLVLNTKGDHTKFRLEVSCDGPAVMRVDCVSFKLLRP